MSRAADRADAVAHRAASRIAEMKWRLVGIGIVALFYVGLWISVAAGASWLEAPLITIPVLVLLIAGGNWLQHWLGVQRRAPQFSRPASAQDDDDGSSAP